MRECNNAIAKVWMKQWETVNNGGNERAVRAAAKNARQHQWRGEDAGSVWRHTSSVSDGLPQGLVASNATPTVELGKEKHWNRRAEQSGVRQLGE